MTEIIIPGVSPQAVRGAAVKEQHDRLDRRMGLFGRVVLWQAALLLAMGYLPYMATGSGYESVRPVIRMSVGQSLVNALLGIVFLLLYLGVRKRNLLCGAASLLASLTAALCSPLLKTAYAAVPLGYHDMALILLPVFVFLFIYLLPLLAGGGVCVKDEADYRQAWDMADWERQALAGDSISMLLPPGGHDEQTDKNVYRLEAGNDRFTIGLVREAAPEGGADSPEEMDGLGGADSPEEADGPALDGSVQVLEEPRDGIMDGIAYHQTAGLRGGWRPSLIPYASEGNEFPVTLTASVGLKAGKPQRLHFHR